MAKKIVKEVGNKKLSEAEKLQEIGNRLKLYRKKAGYSNYEYFAYENNIGRAQYGRYEAGANIQLTTLIKILTALNVSLEDFFKGMD